MTLSRGAKRGARGRNEHTLYIWCDVVPFDASDRSFQWLRPTIHVDQLERRGSFLSLSKTQNSALLVARRSETGGCRCCFPSLALSFREGRTPAPRSAFRASPPLPPSFLGLRHARSSYVFFVVLLPHFGLASVARPESLFLVRPGRTRRRCHRRLLSVQRLTYAILHPA